MNQIYNMSIPHLSIISSVIFARSTPALRAEYMEAANAETGFLYDDDFCPADAVWEKMKAADVEPAAAVCETCGDGKPNDGALHCAACRNGQFQ